MSINTLYKRLHINSICFSVLSLLFVLTTLQACATTKHKKTKTTEVTTTMTVAMIRPATNNQTYIKVSFNESQRIYKLPTNANPAFLPLLTESEKNHTPVIIRRTSEYVDEILEVRKK